MNQVSILFRVLHGEYPRSVMERQFMRKLLCPCFQDLLFQLCFSLRTRRQGMWPKDSGFTASIYKRIVVGLEVWLRGRTLAQDTEGPGFNSQHDNRTEKGPGCNSGVQHSPSMCEALVQIPYTAVNQKQVVAQWHSVSLACSKPFLGSIYLKHSPFPSHEYI